MLTDMHTYVKKGPLTASGRCLVPHSIGKLLQQALFKLQSSCTHSIPKASSLRPHATTHCGCLEVLH